MSLPIWNPPPRGDLDEVEYAGVIRDYLAGWKRDAEAEAEKLRYAQRWTVFTRERRYADDGPVESGYWDNDDALNSYENADLWFGGDRG